MIFVSGELAAAIVEGRKTQLRFPVADEEECRLEVGRRYAVQVARVKRDPYNLEKRYRGSDTEAMVHVLEVGRGMLHEVTLEDARREGFKTRGELWRAFRDRYGMGPGIDLSNYVVEVPIWVVSFKHVDDPPRFLSRRLGYTGSYDQALVSEDAPAVDSATQERISKGEMRSDGERAFEATTERQRDAQRRTMRTRLGKLREVQSRALQRDDVDLTLQLAKIDEGIAEIQRALQQSSRAA